MVLATTLLMSGKVVESVQAAKFPLEYSNHKKPVKGGTLRVGMIGSVTNAPTTSIAGNYLPNDPYNLGHFVTKENTELIRSLSSKEAFNKKYQLKQFHKWQDYMNKEAYIIPMDFRYNTFVSSKKLTNISLASKKGYNLWENIAFTK